MRDFTYTTIEKIEDYASLQLFTLDKENAMKKEMYKSMYETEDYHWYFKAKREIVLSILDKIVKENSKIIDLGCGCGLMLSKLSRYGEVAGVDFSEEAIEYCRASFSGTLYQGDLESITLSEKYNYAVMLDVLEHIKDEERALINIRNILQKGGKLIITVPADIRLWSKHDENCMHYRRYDLKELESVLLKCGYSVNYISYYNSRLYPIVFIIRKVEKIFNIKNKGSHIEYGFKPGIINTILYKVFSGEKKRILKGKKYHKGVSLICIAKRIG